MNALFMIVELMLSIFLERKTRKANHNSSIPCSQTDKDDTAVGCGRSDGKGKSGRSSWLGNTRTAQSVTIAAVDVCELCGEDLSKTPYQEHERGTKIDIAFEKVVEHADDEIKQCPPCGATQ